MRLPRFNRLIIIFIAGFSCTRSGAQTNSRPFIDTDVYKILSIKPRSTDPAIHSWDTAHIVYYDPKIKNNKILLWLTGTNGTSNNVPVEFFKTALGQGYRIIALSFISVPAVSQICVGNRLDADPGCAAAFRRKRIYGDNDFTLIPDEQQDAIIPRFIKLLQWLEKNDTAGNWAQYLHASKPVWNRIAIAGQSQGGGMAAFIAQQETLARVISFSGGWDYANSKEKKIAGWYYNKALTPMDNWYATYNIHELAARQLAEICTALQIPAGHIFAFDKPLFNSNMAATNERPNPYHGDGLRNTAYKQDWISMLGSGL